MTPRLRLPAVDALKPKQVRIYLDRDSEEILSKLVDHSPLTETQIMGVVANAALRAVKSNRYRLTLPLEFAIAEDRELAI